MIFRHRPIAFQIYLLIGASAGVTLGLACTSRPPGAESIQEDRAKRAAFDKSLNDLGHQAFLWFQENRHPVTGMVRDRAPNWRGKGSPTSVASIAAVGYYLSLLPEAVRVGELTDAQAREEAMHILRFARDKLHRHHGLFYHFVDWESGRRWRDCEISLLDSAIFFNGCMVVAEGLGSPVAEAANALVDEADWPQFVITDPKSEKQMLSLGFTPEKGLLSPADVHSSEYAMAYFLAIGSKTHPVDVELWYNTEINFADIAGFQVLNGEHPLFTSYYGLGWHDLRNRTDRRGVNLYDNARKAALANRAFCLSMADRYRSYRETEGGWWGLSAGDAREGYVAQGPIARDVDGTVFPVAALAALPWMVEEFQADLPRWQGSPWWSKVNGDGGLSSFNLEKDWICPDLLGIDLGSFYLSLANYRHETIWKLWMHHPVAVRAMQKLELKPVLPVSQDS